MSEASSRDEIYKNILKINKGIADADNSKRDFSVFKEKHIPSNIYYPANSNNSVEKSNFNLPLTKGPEQLHKDKEGVDVIVEGVLVQADILSKRDGGRPDTRSSFKELVENAIEKRVITRERIDELTLQRVEDVQKNKLVKESAKVISEVDEAISRIMDSLNRIDNSKPANFIKMDELYDNRRRLIALSAQIKDKETLEKIDRSVSQINKTINKIIETVFVKVQEHNSEAQIEPEGLNLKEGRYHASLNIPNIGKRPCVVESIYLKDNDEEIMLGQKGAINGKPYKVDSLVIRLRYMNHRQPKTLTFYPDEVEYLNEGITVNDFQKLEPETT